MPWVCRMPANSASIARFLRLPAELWRKGDDEDLSEGELRKLRAALDNVTRVTVPRGKRKKDTIARLAADATQWRNKLRKEINSVRYQQPAEDSQAHRS